MKKVPVNILNYIMEELKAITFGELVLIVQDGVLIQVEDTKKMRVHPWKGVKKPAAWAAETEKNIRAAIERELASLFYGQLSIVVKEGTVSQLLRLEKQRFMDGDGI